jgi:hypothetical protein
MSDKKSRKSVRGLSVNPHEQSVNLYEIIRKSI